MKEASPPPPPLLSRTFEHREGFCVSSRICKKHAHASAFCLGVGVFLLGVKNLDKNGRMWYNKNEDGRSSKKIILIDQKIILNILLMLMWAILWA